MSRVEPTWGLANNEDNDKGNANDTQVTEPFAHAIDVPDWRPIDLTLPIALGSRLRKSWGEVRARSFENKGTVHVDADAVTIRTSVSRLFRSSIDHALKVQSADVFNVRANGRLVEFDLSNGPGQLETVILRTRDRHEARLLEDALPKHTTRTYATETRERLQYLDRLNQRTPTVWVTWALVAITTLVYIVMSMHGAGFLRVNPTAAIRAGSNFGPYTENGEWWRLLSSVFIHFSLAHIFFNMLVLVQGGKVVERMVGSVRFLGIYLFAGITGSLVSLLWHPTVNSAGASGAIFGVFGAVVAYLVRYNRQVPRSIYLRHSRLAIVFIGYNLLFGFTHQGIDNGAHLGGLFGGFILGLVLPPAPDAVRESKRRWLAFGLAGTLAFGLAGGLTWALADLAARPDRHEILQFRRALYESKALEKSALTDIKNLHPASRSALALNAYALDIRTRLLPEWAQLRETIVDLHLPDGSPELKLQRGLLSYYGDVSMSLEMAADMASDPRKQTSAGSAAAIAMMKKAMQERIELIRQGGVF